MGPHHVIKIDNEMISNVIKSLNISKSFQEIQKIEEHTKQYHKHVLAKIWNMVNSIQKFFILLQQIN
jgi:hypothetical protein